MVDWLRGSTLIVKDSDKNYWGCGQNWKGQTGTGFSDTIIYQPAKIKELSGKDIEILYSSSTDQTFIAKDSDNNYWGWGNNEYGQTGTGPTASKLYRPTQIKEFSGKNIEIVYSCELDNWPTIIARDSDKNYWAWGYNSYGQTGTGSTDSKVYKPTQISAFTGKDIEILRRTNRNETFIVKDSDKNYWSWGHNRYGQTGTGTTDETVNEPTQVKEFTGEDIEMLYSDSDTIILKTPDGRLWGWGYNPYGTLGTGTTDNVYKPTKIAERLSVNNARYLYVENKAQQIIVITADGKLYISGTSGSKVGKFGGYTCVCISDIPENDLYGKTVINATRCGTLNTVVLTTEGKLYKVENTMVTEGLWYEATGSWATGFVVTKDTRYNE